MDIKSKKKEAIAIMKPIWDAEKAREKQECKEWWAEIRSIIKCYFTYPWGHVPAPDSVIKQSYYDGFGPGTFHYADCVVCGTQFKVSG